MMRKWDYLVRGPISQDETKRWVPQEIHHPLPPKRPLKAVVLVAGKGTRLRPLTDVTPKPLLPLFDEPLLEYILDGIVRTGIEDIALIVGYKAEMFKEWIDLSYLKPEQIQKNPWRQGCKFEFIMQTNVNGTGGAVLLAKDWVGSSYCFVTYGDILMSWSVYERIVETFQKNKLEWLLVGNPTTDPSAGAAIYYEGFTILDFIEKPPKSAPKTDLNNAGCYIFPSEIFPLLENTPLSSRKEIELTWPVIERVKNKNCLHLIKMTKDEFWCDVGTVDVYNGLINDSSWLKQVKNTSL